MDDKTVIDLYWVRSQEAITQTDRIYGPLCRKIAGRFLRSSQDVEECVNDTYFALWNTIPPGKARPLSFLSGKGGPQSGPEAAGIADCRQTEHRSRPFL